MQDRYVETLPPGWGALRMLPASRRRRKWPRLWLAAAAVAVASSVIAWIIQTR